MPRPLGSNWHRWDLHVHTPDSLVHEYAGPDPWARFLNGLRALPPDIKVVGINDYLFISGYKRVLAEHQKGNLPNLELILPVIELRLDTFCGSESALKKVNFHIIFSNEVTPEVIENQFMPALVQRYVISNDYDAVVKGTEWQAIPTPASLAQLGQLVRGRVPTDKQAGLNNLSDLQIGFNSLCISHEKIRDILDRPDFKGKTLTAVGKAEWDQLRWSQAGMANKVTLLNEAAFVFTSGIDVAACGRSRQSLLDQSVNPRLLDCSDAHYLSDSAQHNRLGKCFTWIKGEVCFESLRQAYYEYDGRVSLSTDVPPAPLHHIQRVKIALPENITWQGAPFCFRGNHEFEFHPSFTCLIGGRGSGKSTLLNLLATGLHGRSPLFDRNPVNCGARSLPEFISVDCAASPESVEFISQNEVESYASPTGGFTEAVIRRLGKVEGAAALLAAEEELARNVEILKERETLFRQYFTEHQAAAKDEADLKHNQKIVQSVADPAYQALSTAANALAKESAGITDARKHLKALVDKLGEALDLQPAEDLLAKNAIAETLTAAYGELSALRQRLAEAKFEEVTKREVVIALEEAALKEKIGAFLKEQKLSPENLQDIEAATKRIAQLQVSVPQLVKKRDATLERINQTNATDAPRAAYETALGNCLTAINRTLENVSTEVKAIRLQYVFDKEAALAWLAERTLALIREQDPAAPSVRKDHLQEILRTIPFEFSPPDDAFLNAFQQAGNKTGELLFRIFSSKKALRLLQNAFKVATLDARTFRRIEVKYDGRPFAQCSFGQRCTAVLVLLISIGNTPLIIDEPEAHLDSSLVANFLVDLIKRKKLERQLIFATHNANFVVNGDAELIHYMSIEGAGATTSFPLTIENVAHREILMALEGGLEAFRRRHRKYYGAPGL
jgi:energy-coupling factor transporter ATP-binding protein EcfA2